MNEDPNFKYDQKDPFLGLLCAAAILLLIVPIIGLINVRGCF